MERVLEVIFDYVCSYCYMIHDDLKELKDGEPDLIMKFIPCESHPRPERYGMHSDLCIRGMYYCMDRGIDVWEYHDRIFDAVFENRVNIENLDELAACLKDIVNEKEFKKILSEKTYQDRIERNNSYAWGELRLPAVPALRMNQKVLRAVPDLGITKRQIRDFIQG